MKRPHKLPKSGSRSIAKRSKTVVAKQRTATKGRLVLDIETEQFTEELRQAKDIKMRLALAPKMRLAYAFDGANRRGTTPTRAVPFDH